jgi:hypothetical protein
MGVGLSLPSYIFKTIGPQNLDNMKSKQIKLEVRAGAPRRVKQMLKKIKASNKNLFFSQNRLCTTT